MYALRYLFSTLNKKMQLWHGFIQSANAFRPGHQCLKPTTLVNVTPQLHLKGLQQPRTSKHLYVCMCTWVASWTEKKPNCQKPQVCIASLLLDKSGTCTRGRLDKPTPSHWLGYWSQHFDFFSFLRTLVGQSVSKKTPFFFRSRHGVFFYLSASCQGRKIVKYVRLGLL